MLVKEPTEIRKNKFQVPEAFQNLIDKVESTMKFSIEVEEKVPLDQVTNFNEVSRKKKKRIIVQWQEKCRSIYV